MTPKMNITQDYHNNGHTALVSESWGNRKGKEAARMHSSHTIKHIKKGGIKAML